MKDVYVLRNMKTVGIGNIVCVADDFEYCAMRMADFTPQDQRHLTIENHDLHEAGDE